MCSKALELIKFLGTLHMRKLELKHDPYFMWSKNMEPKPLWAPCGLPNESYATMHATA